MGIKNILFAFILFALTIQSAKSTTWTTISSGYWNNPFIWSSGVVPAYNSSDTFIIDHPVVFDSDIILNSNAFLKINTEGGLCGHHNIKVNTGASILKYGILELDTFFIPGGSVNCLVPGHVTLSMYGVISGGSLSVSCAMSVGPWFECAQPTFAFALTNVGEEADKAFNLFPNPSNGNFTLVHSYSSLKTEVQIIDVTGRLVFRKDISNSTGTEKINAWGLKPGIYYWELISDKNIASRGKMIIK